MGEQAPRIPREWNVSADWMTEVLRTRHPGAVVSDVVRVGGSEGASSRAVLGVTYSSGSGPATDCGVVDRWRLNDMVVMEDVVDRRDHAADLTRLGA